MRILRYWLVTALVCGLSGVAKADDFQMVVVDPVPLATITTYDITSIGSPLTVSWSTCAPGELPAGTTGYIGCVSLLNGTGVKLTNLDLSVPDTEGVVGQTAGCPTDTNDVFAVLNCNPNPVGGHFLLDFSGGSGIPPSGFFVLAESGVDPGAFPDTTVVGGVSPEPSSALLLSTGVLSMGLFAAYRRRRNLCESRP